MQLILTNPPKRRKGRSSKSKSTRRRKRRAPTVSRPARRRKVRRAAANPQKGAIRMAARRKTRRRGRARRAPVTKVTVRRRRRSTSRRGGALAGLSLKGLKGFINKDLMTGAGGVMAIAVAGPLVLNKLRSWSTTDATTGTVTPKLKFLQYTDSTKPDYIGAAVLAGVGILAAMAARRFYPKLAVPLAIGGIGSAGAMVAFQYMSIRKTAQLAAQAKQLANGSQTASPGNTGVTGLLGYVDDGSGVSGYVSDNAMAGV